MNDDKLYALCEKYSKFIRYGRQKFIGLLPEVFKSRMYERKGFASIHEFAAKLAYMSREQVDLVLNINRRLEDKPALQSLLLNGEASVNKLARVVSIATKENQETLAAQVKLLPQKALETLVRDEKRAGQAAKTEDQNGVQKPLLDDKNLRAQTLKSNLKIDLEVLEEINELQEKGIDINKLLKEMLARREENLEERKDAAARKADLAAAKIKTTLEEKNVETAGNKPKKSRYISVHVKRIIQEEHGDKCSISGCKKDSRQLHHTQRFALSGTHNPRYMAPMCEDHHKIAHSIDIRFHHVRRVNSG